jgi:hypothetical protein
VLIPHSRTQSNQGKSKIENSLGHLWQLYSTTWQRADSVFVKGKHMNTKKTSSWIVLTIVAAIAVSGIAGARPAAADLKSVADVKSDMRKLWKDY